MGHVGGEPPRTFRWTADQPEAGGLAELLGAHGIRVRQLVGLVARGSRLC
ncbi:MAG TPA: hypothetical protein VF173_09920 [Thermoanaerobaculia bacterium]|nr:hypothetical protein [Thermoanaerobaculia bacterium]